MSVYICKPYIRHLFEKPPLDFKHQIHKWTLGIILIDHIEPNGEMASKKHSILLNLIKFKERLFLLMKNVLSITILFISLVFSNVVRFFKRKLKGFGELQSKA